MYTNMVFGTVKSVLFIEVSSFQGVLNKGFHCNRCSIQIVLLGQNWASVPFIKVSLLLAKIFLISTVSILLLLSHAHKEF